MAIEDIGERLEGKGWLGAVIGAVVLAPVVVPAVARGLRPVAKGAIKGYLTLSERARELAAEAGEQLQDLVAEARAEHEADVHEGDGLMAMELSTEGERTAAGAAARRHSDEEEEEEEEEEERPRARSARKKEVTAAEAA